MSEPDLFLPPKSTPPEFIVHKGFRMVITVVDGYTSPRYMACTSIRENGSFQGTSSIGYSMEESIEKLMKVLSRKLWKQCQ